LGKGTPKSSLKIGILVDCKDGLGVNLILEPLLLGLKKYQLGNWAESVEARQINITRLLKRLIRQLPKINLVVGCWLLVVGFHGIGFTAM
jgi:hypothetical protein